MDASDLLPGEDDGLHVLGLDMMAANDGGGGIASFMPALKDSPHLLLSSAPSFIDPFDELRRRLNIGADQPEDWEPMEGHDYFQRRLFGPDGPDVTKCKYSDEALRVLNKPFAGVLPETPLSLQDALQCIKERTQFQVQSVDRVQNHPRRKMHGEFARCYHIENTRQVYHGTTAATAATIARVGFRNAASQRAKFGKGIYSASNIWEALAYAEPDARSWVQTFLVAELLEGPTRVGTENMIDFGCDEAGRQIVTTTNPDQNIFCAAYEDQLYPRYIVKVCMSDTQLSPLAQRIVRIYHPTIWSRLQKPSLPSAAYKPAVVTAALPAAVLGPVSKPQPVVLFKEITCHLQYQVGDLVKVVHTFVNYQFALEAKGHIRKMVKDGSVYFFVELADAALREQTRGVNGTRTYAWPTDSSWLRCHLRHIQPVSPKVSASASDVATQPASAVPAPVLAAQDLAAGVAGGKKRKR